MERPKIDKEIIARAAWLTASTTSNIPAEDRKALGEDIARAYSYYPTDGYELAKQLESYGWDVDTIFVDDMDCMDSNVREIHLKVEKKWFEENDIQPPYPIGSRTTKGEIVGIDDYGVANYKVKPYGQDDSKSGKRRLIIRFEDVVLAEKETA